MYLLRARPSLWPHPPAEHLHACISRFWLRQTLSENAAVGVLLIFIFPDVISALSFLAGSVFAFKAICNWHENGVYETGGAETLPV